MKLADLSEGAYKAAVKRQAKDLAKDLSTYQRGARKYWAGELSKPIASAMSRSYKRPPEVVRKDIVKHTLKMIGEEMNVDDVMNPQGLERNIPVSDQPSFKIYVDLDGVLVDFDKKMAEIGFPRHTVENDKKAKSKFWQTVGWMAKNGKPFWGAMTPMPDAHVLWNYVTHIAHPEILSATGHVGNATEEKHEWVKRHLGADIPVHLVRKSSDKAQFAAPNHILIDDREKSIEPFVAAGGVGILHKSAADTIRQLKALGAVA